MMPPLLSKNQLNVIVDMIRAHEIQFGKPPEQIIIPVPQGLKVMGVPVKFHLHPNFFSMDSERAFHHHPDNAKWYAKDAEI